MAIETIEQTMLDEIDNNIIEPSKTLFLNRNANSLAGEIDGVQAVRQAVELQLDTMRFGYEIFDASYGSELEYLIGKPFAFVKTEIRRVVTEACMRDDRVLDVTVYAIEQINLTSMQFNADVVSVFGEFSLEEVQVELWQ